MTNKAGKTTPRRVVELHGHRGARGLMPENTLEGFAFALSIGVQILELDVQLTRDGMLVTTHDLHLSSASTRDKNGAWLEDTGPEVIALSQKALQTYDVGGLKSGTEYGDRFPDQAVLSEIRIPSLDDVILLCLEKGDAHTKLNIEVKSDATVAHHEARAERVVDQLLACLRHHDFTDRVILQSFDWMILDLFREKAPDICRSYLTLLEANIPDGGKGARGTVYAGSPWLGQSDFDAHDGDIPSMITAQGGSYWSSFFSDLSEERVEAAHQVGLRVYAWTVNEFDDIEHMLDLGVDGIITDYPGRVQRALIRRGMHWRQEI